MALKMRLAPGLFPKNGNQEQNQAMAGMASDSEYYLHPSVNGWQAPNEGRDASDDIRPVTGANAPRRSPRPSSYLVRACHAARALSGRATLLRGLKSTLHWQFLDFGRNLDVWWE